MSDHATADDLRSLVANLNRIWPVDYSRDLDDRRERVRAHLTRDIAEAERARIVFLPVNEGWELGFEGSTEVYVYPHGPAALLAAHSAFASRKAIDIAPFLSGRPVSALVASNNLRNALRRRLAPWIESRTGCKPLVDAIRMIQVTSEGYLLYDPPCNAPRILI